MSACYAPPRIATYIRGANFDAASSWEFSMRQMLTSVLSLALIATVTTACGGKQNNDDASVVEQTVEATASLRVIHAAAAPTATAFLNDVQLGGTISAGSEAGPLDIPVGSRTLSVRAADGTTELASSRETFEADTEYTVVVGGTLESLLVIVLGDTVPTPVAGQSFVRFVNASSAAVTIQQGERAVADGLAPGATTNFLEMAPESYRFEGSSGDLAEGLSISVNDGHVYLVTAYSTGSALAYVVTTLR
jgi:hypothetical protein